jgi:phosphatidylinositol glycan class T
MADWGRFSFVFLWLLGIGSVVGSLRSEQFAESLVVRPLADGRVLGHFQFVNELGSGHGRHHKLFPKAIFQIVQAFRIQEMELSFTQGRWDHRLWGALESADVKPGGVELWAHFRPSNDDVDMLWRNLTHALSGLFCASINFLEDPAMVSNWGSWDMGVMGAVRQGSLPREAVCTENLTPWLKLLPCRDRAGLSTLLERPRIHNANYYSLRVHVKAGNGIDTSLRLSQTLSVVLKSSDASRWSLSSLFGRPLLGSCPLASSSHVHLELDANLVEALKRATGNGDMDVDVNSNEMFSLNLAPEGVSSGVASVFLNYDVQKCSEAHPLDVGMSWRVVLAWSPRQGPFRATQFLTGRGNGGGAIVSVVNANGCDGMRWCPVGDDGSVDVTTFQIVPWYVRLYMHTLQVVVDGERVKKGVRLKLSPADDRKSPAVVEIGVTVPRNTSVVVLSVEFDKGYLRIDEHPPDANRGFDLPAALFTFTSSGPGSRVQIYSDNLLVLLATPDFSMPYNVITFTMTALALYFGSLLNSLRLRSVTDVEVQQPASRISTKLKKLLARFRGREKVKTL